MKRNTVLAVTVFAGLVLANQSFADDVDLERIVVTPSRTQEAYGDSCRKVEVVSSKQLEAAGVTDASEALTKLTSVNISNYGGIGANKNVKMRGSTASQVLIMVDGRPINSPRDGVADLSSIPLDNIDHIEVMRGPASSLYGSSAMGGTVNIITKKIPLKNKTEFTTGFGTFRTYVEKISNGGRVGKFGYLATGQYQSSVGARGNSQFDSKDFNTKFEYAFSDTNKLSVDSGFLKSWQGTPGPASSPDPNDKQGTLKNSLVLNWNFKPDRTSEIILKAYNDYDRLEFLEDPAKNVHTTKVTGYDLQASKNLLDNFRVLAGYNFVHNLNDSTTSAKHKYSVQAWFVSGQLELWDKLKFDLSSRFDNYSNFGSQANPSFSALYSFNQNNKAHILYSHSFRAPTFNDLYWPDEGWAKGNSALGPEKGRTYEIGYESKVCQYWAASFNYYHNNYRQLINWAETSGGVWQPTNVNKAIINGLEFENKIYLPLNLELDLNYTYMLARDKDTHKYLIYQPKNKLDIALKFKDKKGLSLAFTSQFNDKVFHDAANTISVKKFFIFGMTLSKKVNQALTFYASIDNMSNRSYQVIRDYPMPGFSINGGLKMEI